MSSPLETKVDLAIDNIASVLEIPSRIYKDKLPCVVDDLDLENSSYFLEDNVIYIKDNDLASIYEESGHFLHECVRSEFSLKKFLDSRYGSLNYFFHLVNGEAFGYFCQRLSGKARNLKDYSSNEVLVKMEESMTEEEKILAKKKNEALFEEYSKMVRFSKGVVDFKKTLYDVIDKKTHHDKLFQKFKKYFSETFVDVVIHSVGYNLGNKLYEKDDLRLVNSFIKSPKSCGLGNYLRTYKKLN